MLEAMGLKTGIDLAKLVALRTEIEHALQDQPFHGTIARAGLPKGFAPAAAA
jgi:hydroxymethylglutaryl-CoA lyase